MLWALTLAWGGSSVFASPTKEDAPAKVELPTLTITLQDEDGEPIRGVTLSAIMADSTGREKGRATTDTTGKAVFRNLKSGRYYFFAHMNELRKHPGYGMQLMVRALKTSRTFFLSEPRIFDLSANAESTFLIKRGEHIWIETYLQVVRSGKVIILNQEMGLQHIIPVASTDYLQIYLPMRTMYGLVTIKDDDFDSWVLEIYAHERLRINLL
jgi:uncharacterized surface anchored protein